MTNIEILDLPLSSQQHTEIDADVQLVRQWGGSASDAVLDHTCRTFRTAGIDGFIGYREAVKTAIVYGDPICAPEQRDALIAAFDAFCRQRKMQVVYVMATEGFAEVLFGRYAHSLVEFGEELWCDPAVALEGKGPQGRLVRKKVRRAHNEGISVEEYIGDSAGLEARIEEVGKLWLEGRRGPQIYIAHVSLFQDRHGKRWFYAECKGELVGVLTLDRIDSVQGWFLSHMMILNNAPVGAPEVLVVHVMELLRAEGCRHLSFGVVPGDQLGEIRGFSRFSNKIARMLFRMSRRCFLLDGKKVFWGKFQPCSAPSYILFSEESIGLRSLMAMTQAFNVIKV